MDDSPTLRRAVQTLRRRITIFSGLWTFVVNVQNDDEVKKVVNEYISSWNDDFEGIISKLWGKAMSNYGDCIISNKYEESNAKKIGCKISPHPNRIIYTIYRIFLDTWDTSATPRIS